ncbi:Hypothetical protein D9617_8g049220 [Elsinoe fawcettii]|nr:Hypothetical protein D9617_8g049220 [Elsinoe fawcettii]
MAESTNDTKSSPGHGITKFVSRPDIRALTFNVTKHIPALIAPGYWFVTPHDKWIGQADSDEPIPFQVGPHIYDGDGELIWSGARAVQGRLVQDFRPYGDLVDNTLSFVVQPTLEQRNASERARYVVMDSTYTERMSSIAVPKMEYNAHEYKLTEGGRKALTISTRTTSLPRDDGSLAYYMEDCVLEKEIAGGHTLFDWCPLAHGVKPDESFEPTPRLDRWKENRPWDFMHINSVDKFEDGDFLMSARSVSTIYKVSHVDKSIVWRLGGKLSDFSADFNFSSQHDARIVSSNATTTLITLLDNAAAIEWQHRDTARSSSALMVALHTSQRPMQARILRRWIRPDGKLSRKMGNVDLLRNGNVFIGWAEQSYLSEHTAEGQLLLEARFSAIEPLFTYRAYKAHFIGHPQEKPILAASGLPSASGSTQSVHVSWNGATEVVAWKFMGLEAGKSEKRVVATVPRSGFETSLNLTSVWSSIYAVAIDSQGAAIGESEVVRTSTTPVEPSMDLSPILTGSAILVFVGICLANIMTLKKFKRYKSRYTSWLSTGSCDTLDDSGVALPLFGEKAD